MPTAFHHVLFAQGAATPPEWVHLIPAGTFKGADGRGPYHLHDAQAVISASMAAGRLPIDENHATDLAAPRGGPSPARGWIVELQARSDGIWGRVEWTDAGAVLMSDRAYKGISPVFLTDRSGVISQLERAALTNTPNLLQLESLNSRQETTGMDLVQLRATLGLPATADETAIVAAIAANAQAVALHSQHITAIAGAAGLEASLTPEGLVTALQARQAAGNPADLANQVVSLQTQLTTMQADRARERATAFVDTAIRAGKQINPLRDHYIARHMADPAAVEREVGAMTAINAGGVPAQALNARVEPDGDEATDAEKAVAAKMNLDPKKLVATRKKRAAEGGKV